VTAGMPLAPASGGAKAQTVPVVGAPGVAAPRGVVTAVGAAVAVLTAAVLPVVGVGGSAAAIVGVTLAVASVSAAVATDAGVVVSSWQPASVTARISSPNSPAVGRPPRRLVPLSCALFIGLLFRILCSRRWLRAVFRNRL